MSSRRPYCTPGDKHLASGAISVKPCARCRQTVFAGLAEGLHVRVDPTPLTPDAADAHAVAGRTVYVLAHAELVHRDDTRLGLPGLLLPVHVCAQPVPAAMRATIPTLAPNP